jgi:hypothetical protein
MTVIDLAKLLVFHSVSCRKAATENQSFRYKKDYLQNLCGALVGIEAEYSWSG